MTRGQEYMGSGIQGVIRNTRQGVKSPFDSFAFSAALIDQSVMRCIGQENGLKRPEDIILTFPE